MRLVSLTIMLGSLVVATSCNLDPWHSTHVSIDGPEDPDFPNQDGLHRPGQPCGDCHSDKGPASSSFLLSGTIFWGNKKQLGVDNAYVRIVDAKGGRHCFVTSCSGNFYVPDGSLRSLVFPLVVSVERTTDPGKDESTFAIRRMSGHIGREGSCGACHLLGINDWGSPGEIHLFDSEKDVDDKQVRPPVCPPAPDDHPLTACPEDRHP